MILAAVGHSGCASFIRVRAGSGLEVTGKASERRANVAEGVGVKGREDKHASAERPFEAPLCHCRQDDISSETRKRGGGLRREFGLAIPALTR